MEQVRNEQTIYSAAVYCRLSKDDEQAGESVSIETQKMMLTDFCHERGFSIYEIYADDGYSGLNFNRPAFTRLLEDIDSGKVNLVITKDLSRLGRDYIQTGYYTDVYFSRKRVRYIAVNDGISGKTTTYYYDALDRLTLKEIRTSGVLSLAVRYQYDEEDQLIGKTIFSEGQSPVHTAYAYDHLHNLSQITGEDVFQKISYSSHGLLEQTSTGYTSGGTDHTVKQETYIYGTADTSLHQHTVTYGGKTNTDTYTYDGRGNITQITRKVGSTEYIIKYTYDAANQLIREDNQQAGYTWAMTYDNAGNMTSRKKHSYTTGSVGTPLSTQTFTYGDSTWGDLLTGINGTTVTSDVIGNILNDGTWTYTWKNGRQLATMSKSGVTWSFAYDVSGMRTQRTNGSTTYTYTYDDSTLLKMTVGSNALIFCYGTNGLPLSVNFNGVDYYYVTNARGDVIGILNSSGTEVVTYIYDAWGNILSTSGTMASTLGTHNPLRYRGYVYDQETGLYYLQSRYYNPTICRFISVDAYVSTGQGIFGYNMFAYCRNNPASRKDATGTADISYTQDDETPWDDMIPDNLGRGGSGAGGASYKTGTSSSGYNSGQSSTAIAKCFIAGTLVQTENGATPIEEITTDDKVWAWNEETSNVTLKQVVETYINETSELMHIFVNGEEIVTTPEHPFYSPVKSWTSAWKLRAGDILVLLNGKYVVVEKIQHEILEAPIAVYNFQVEDYHTYYVAGGGVLVHNSCNHNSAWNSERKWHWKDAASTATVNRDYGAYVATQDNINRMNRGLAPIGWDGYPVHLHHWDGIANNFYNYSPVSRTLHQIIHWGGMP